MAHNIVRFTWSLPLYVTLCFGCVSDQVNRTIADSEKGLERDAAQQLLSQTDVLVAHVKDVVPTSDISFALPGSRCTLHFTDTADTKSLSVQSPPCDIDVPQEGHDFTVHMSLAALSFTAQRSGVAWLLSGSGELDLSADLPLFGTYEGVVHSSVTSSSVNTQTQAVELHLDITYMSGQSAVDLKVDATGTPEHITGAVTAPDFKCTVSGSLKTPVIQCS